jgi:hypothetical protein
MGVRLGELPTSFDGIDFQGCVASGLGEARFHLNSTLGHGWNFAAMVACPNTPQGIQLCQQRAFEVRGNAASQSGRMTLGRTQTKTVPPPFGGYNCQDSAGGDLCQYTAGVITLFPTEFREQAGWAAATPTQKCQMVKNVTKHEYFHMAGLGHAGTSNSAIMRAGGPGTGTATSGPRYSSGLLPTSTENTALQRFNSGSSTSPR